MDVNINEDNSENSTGNSDISSTSNNSIEQADCFISAPPSIDEHEAQAFQNSVRPRTRRSSRGRSVPIEPSERQEVAITALSVRKSKRLAVRRPRSRSTGRSASRQRPRSKSVQKARRSKKK